MDIWSREIASAGTGMAPGLCAMVGGRPKATPCLRLFSFLYPKSELPATITLDDKKENYIATANDAESGSIPISKDPTEEHGLLSGKEQYPLAEIAFARSGDKGDTCNIGIIARHPAFVPYIRQALTASDVAKYFAHFLEPENSSVPIEHLVERFDLPGFDAVNFLLKNSLGGGGMASLRPDPLGKSFGQMLLSYQLKNMPPIFEILKAYDETKK